MIKADLGVIQALFDLNTVFAVKQNNGHKDCSIFNLNLLRPCGQMFFLLHSSLHHLIVFFYFTHRFK